MTINASIDAGIQQAVTTFALVRAALRERFAAVLAHDMRNPLGAASAAPELILRLDDPVQIKSVAAKAFDNVHRMDGMIHELLDTMAFHSGEQLALAPSHFDIRALVDEVRRDQAASSGERVRVGGVPVAGWWDRAAINRAFTGRLFPAHPARRGRR